ncbi:undecaprenyl-phosphate glucose phosphotransferase [Shewanella sp. 202IG2-18]|uniref:undecaprenyl-phosphate glucose phosphotransferase n=1 Tax=Parashewanella hymeniacidonis TaxID=2807618 RepID=UPI001961721B|nr:undecaprenyl-phosphate glucose phosphotransferase [Parashewanella hymeniacidonis]MBM7072039.1 undecaprenyl-phosphate glucose phosphotransferase [Parashewanella hymeniacidonis]
MNMKGVLHSHSGAISLMQRTLDLCFIVLALLISKVLWSSPWIINDSLILMGALLLFLLIAEAGSLYISWRGLSLYQQIKKVALYWGLSAGIVLLVSDYFEVHYGELQIEEIHWFSITLLFLISYRVALNFGLKSLRSKGMNTRTVVIAGAGHLGSRLHQQFSKDNSLGFKFLGFYDDGQSGGRTDNQTIIGDLERLVVDCKAGGIDRVYLTLPMRAESRIKWLVKELSDTTVSLYIVPDVFTFELLHARTDTLNGIPTISIYDSPLDGANAIVKRIEDIVLSSIILVLISPVLLAVAAAVKFTSPGPIIFKQKRYGIDGKSIEVYKFRSMSVMENSDKVIQATKNDARLTPVGAFIRKTSLDELPQFVNALQGRMSIVGPRPHAVAHNEEYRKLVDGYMLRHKVKPGITGWAQVNGWRGETDTLDKMEKRVEYDLNYIRNWSLGFDLKIIFGTIFKGFINKNAY